MSRIRLKKWFRVRMNVAKATIITPKFSQA
jgi:hypothetical protein